MSASPPRQLPSRPAAFGQTPSRRILSARKTRRSASRPSQSISRDLTRLQSRHSSNPSNEIKAAGQTPAMDLCQQARGAATLWLSRERTGEEPLRAGETENYEHPLSTSEVLQGENAIHLAHAKAAKAQKRGTRPSVREQVRTAGRAEVTPLRTRRMRAMPRQAPPGRQRRVNLPLPKGKRRTRRAIAS